MDPQGGRSRTSEVSGLVPPYASEHFADFLRQRDLAILDVRAGAAPGSRRLLLGRPESTTASWTVALAPGGTTESPVTNEERVLAHAHSVLRDGVRAALPRAADHVEVYTSMDGLLLTAVPGLPVGSRRRTARRTRDLLTAVPRWVVGLWEDSATGRAPVDLGTRNVRNVLMRHQPIPRLEPALDAVRRAAVRLAQYDVPQTLTHGCLCPEHVLLSDAGLGVDDWGAGSTSGDPLRDVGRFALRVAGGRLPEVLVGRSSFAAEIRQFMSTVLVHTPVPAQLWREVLVLTQLELAAEALEHADPNGMHLLSRAVRLSGALNRTR